MIRWREAYERVSKTPMFLKFFGQAGMPDFRYMAYNTILPDMTPGNAVDGGEFGQVVGPINQQFPAGAVVLGITSAGWQNDCDPTTQGRRDRYGLAFQYSGNELITGNGITMAETLLGSGRETIFPGKELLIPPSQTILVSGASLCPVASKNITAHVTFHCMVPRAAL